MVSKTDLARFQGKVFLIGTILIALLILWSLFGSASGAFHLIQTPDPTPVEPSITIPEQFDNRGEIPVSDIFSVISTLMDIPFQTLLTIAVLIVAVIIAIPLILIARRGKKK